VIDKILYNFFIATESIAHNKLRSLLTSLGIIFGVASVIAMLAVGAGAQQEILAQMKLLGANNIIIKPVIEQEEGQVEEEADPQKAEKKPFSPGLTMADAHSIERLVPGVEMVSPEVVVETDAIRAGLRRSAKLVGVDSTYFARTDFVLAEGSGFTAEQLRTAAPVAIIGHKVKTRFFTKEPALGGRIKCGNLWLTVVGVLEERALSEKSIEDLGIRDFNYDIYTPVQTMLLRFENRAQLTQKELQQAEQDRAFNEGGGRPGPVNYHQIDQLTVRVAGSALVQPVAEVVSRMLKRRHYGVVDYEVVIPEQLLRQERRTQAIFNIVLAAIASISLIVGGIGIMNIMLASVLERTREVGIRRSLGATRHDIVLQFLIEAITISFTGGLLGILLGVLLSLGIERSTGIVTVISPLSVGLAFLVSVTVGLVFGLLPAQRAAEHDPVVALRYE
jgi:putative ABC transport system permease protein